MQLPAFGKGKFMLLNEHLICLKQVFRVMRLTAAILLVCFTHVCAGVWSQTISFSGKAVSLEKVFKIIEQQTGYTVAANAKVIRSVPTVSIEANKQPLETFLENVLAGLPLEFTIENKTIFISGIPPRKSTIPGIQKFATDSPPVRGIVKDAGGAPLRGASIRLKGTQKGTSTNENGEFEIDAVPGDILMISYIGFQDQQLKVTDQNITVVLQPSESRLDEIQVMAYGTTSMRRNTGNISTVKSEEIAKQPVNNPLQALQGRIPGIFITQSTGLPGSAMKVRIQGQNSIGMGNDPLYVVDGVPYVSQLLPSVGESLENNGSPLAFINPSDIESIDVLKDADATAIYGSRAAGGAVLITTKKGKAGKTKLDLNLQKGWADVTRRIKLLNTEQYLELSRLSYINDGIDINTPPYNTPAYISGLLGDLLVWDQHSYTDWQKELLGGTAVYDNAGITVSGGTGSSNYLVGAAYHKETTVFPIDYADAKTSLHFSFNNSSENGKFKLSLSGNYVLDNNRLPGAPDLTSVALTLPPNAPALYNADGSLNWATYGEGAGAVSTWNNPLAAMQQKVKIKTNNLIGNGVISYELMPGLIVKSNFGYTYMQVNELRTFPSTISRPENRSAFRRVSRFADNNISSWIAEPQVSYKVRVGNGQLEGLVGLSFQEEKGDGMRLEAAGFNSDNVMEDIRSATIVKPLEDRGTTIYTYRYNALFGRLNYHYERKYLFNFTVRRDGSSRFGSRNRFHNFASVGAAWIFSDEQFMKNLQWLSFGKFKVSYGTTGNDQIGNYSFLSLYFPMNTPENPYQGESGLEITGLPNPYLQWEETRKFSVGLDMGFIKDRLLANIVYYKNRSSNQLLSASLAATAGYTSIKTNLPAVVQNDGWEIAFSSVNIRSKAFTWTSSVNLTVPRNKLASFDGLEESPYYSDTYIVGKPIDLMKVYRFLGVNPETGLNEYASKAGGATSTPDFATDRLAVLTNTNTPVWYGGIQNNFRYKNFQLDFLVSVVKQRGQAYEYGTGMYGPQSNQPVAVAGAWRKKGDQSKFQRYVSYMSFDNFYPAALLSGSDAMYTDASYIRLKNVSLSWKLPEHLVKKASMQQMKLFVQAQNLLTITGYKGLDPENKSTVFLPLLSVVSVGVQLTL